MKFVVFKKLDQLWYWELAADEGNSIASSSLGFKDKKSAFSSIQNFRLATPNALVYDLVGNPIKDD